MSNALQNRKKIKNPKSNDEKLLKKKINESAKAMLSKVIKNEQY